MSRFVASRAWKILVSCYVVLFSLIFISFKFILKNKTKLSWKTKRILWRGWETIKAIKLKQIADKKLQNFFPSFTRSFIQKNPNSGLRGKQLRYKRTDVEVRGKQVVLFSLIFISFKVILKKIVMKDENDFVTRMRWEAIKAIKVSCYVVLLSY